MQFSFLVNSLDLLGTFVFGLSGALAGVKRRMDLLGLFVLSTVTAVGGGTLRSILIGDIPVPILQKPSYLACCLLSTLLVFGFSRQLKKFRKAIVFFDAIGLGIFVSIGISVALEINLPAWASLLMGIISGAFGGVIRDILSAEVPLIFRREIYATAGLIGGLLFLFLRFLQFPQEITICCAALLVCFVRLLSIRFGWGLPKALNLPK